MVWSYHRLQNTVNVLNFHTLLTNFPFMQLFLKILSGMANGVDPNQTAPEGTV